MVVEHRIAELAVLVKHGPSILAERAAGSVWIIHKVEVKPL